METKIHPALAVVIILIFCSALGFKFVADGEALNYLGPGHMHTDMDGNLYIQVNNQLLKHNAQGKFEQRYDLSQIGVDTMFGDFAFFNNGDVLIRIGPYNPGLLENIAHFLRLTNRTPVEAPDEHSGLFRCNLDSNRCERFGDGSVDFNRAYHLYIDPLNEDVYAADASRHLLRKFDKKGQQIATQEEGFKFPNQLVVNDGKLYIADTNHHQIHVVVAHTENFGETIEKRSTLVKNIREPGERAREIWPAALAIVGDQWWVNNMGSAMRDGGIYLFGGDWQFQQRLALPDNADPIDIVNFNDRVLITDTTLRRVYQVSKSGLIQQDFQSEGLNEILADNQRQYDHYKKLSNIGLVIFVLLFVIAILVIIVFEIKSKKKVKDNSNQIPFDGIEISPSLDEQQLDINNPDIRWIEPKPFYGKYSTNILVLSCTMMVVLLVVMSLWGKCCDLLRISIPFLLFIIPSYYLTKYVFGTRIGVYKDMLVLMDYRRRYAVGKDKRILLGKTEIFIDDIVVFLGQRFQPIYSRKKIDLYVMPLLKKARTITPFQKQKQLFKQKNPALVWSIIFMLLAFFLLLILRS